MCMLARTAGAFYPFFCGPALMMLRYALCFAASLLEFARILHGISQNYGDLFGGPHNEHYIVFGGLYFGHPYLGKLPYRIRGLRFTLNPIP